MAEQSHNPDENPLEDAAAELSAGFDSKPVEINEASPDQVRGGQIWMKQSAARSVQASAVHLEDSAAALVRATSIDAHDSAIAVAMSREMSLKEVASTLLVAGKVKGKEVRTVALVAGRVEGEVKTVFTPLTALAVGAGIGLALAATKMVFARLSTRRK